MIPNAASERGTPAEAVPERKTIMLVDDTPTVLAAGKEVLKDYYRVYPIPSGDILLDLLDNILPDLILLDVEMPGMNGYEVIAALKSNPKWKNIPVIFLTALSDEGSELEGLSLGAIDYIVKPFSPPLFLKRLHNHLQMVEREKQLETINSALEDMVNQKIFQVMRLQRTILNTVADLVEFRDGATGGHIARTQKYINLLVEAARKEGVYTEEMANWNMDYLISSAQLHDVGKIAVPDLILGKPDKLTPEEIALMRKHVEAGVRAIKKIEDNMRGEVADSSFLRHARMIAGGHHEKWDGTGYPLGLQGQDIPLEGRLMAIADVYDALVSTRPYKKPMTTEEAKRYIEAGRGVHFDPLLVDVFVKVADQFAAIARTTAY